MSRCSSLVMYLKLGAIEMKAESILYNLKRLIREQNAVNGDYDDLYFGVKDLIKRIEERIG